MSTPGTGHRPAATSVSAASGDGRETYVDWRPGQGRPSQHRRLLALLFGPAAETEPPPADETGGDS